MVNPSPVFSRSQVNRAGKILLSSNPSQDDRAWAEAALSNWRASHVYPINTFQATLRSRVKALYSDAIVAQRLKRSPSIIAKLMKNPKMQLSRMQDIGGLRAVVGSVNTVRKLEDLYRRSRFQHRLVGEKDYIANPKSSGYRGIHLMYRYKNAQAPQYDGLVIELQLRSKIQHAWATAVEIFGTFLDEPLKASEGSEEWLKFFRQASASFAHLEACKPSEEFSAQSTDECYLATVREAKRLRIRERLEAIAVATRHAAQPTGGSYYLMELNLGEQFVRIKPFGRRRLAEANHEYSTKERGIKQGLPIQVVLVSTSTLGNLRRAYPNYFLDAREFIKYIDFIERIMR